jgi:hypothetical protein
MARAAREWLALDLTDGRPGSSTPTARFRRWAVLKARRRAWWPGAGSNRRPSDFRATVSCPWAFADGQRAGQTVSTAGNGPPRAIENETKTETADTELPVLCGL